LLVTDGARAATSGKHKHHRARVATALPSGRSTVRSQHAFCVRPTALALRNCFVLLCLALDDGSLFFLTICFVVFPCARVARRLCVFIQFLVNKKRVSDTLCFLENCAIPGHGCTILYVNILPPFDIRVVIK
jgi:hypothetical protein